MKAVAPHVLYILIVIAFSIFALIAIFSKWLGPYQTEMIRSACISKLTKYCLDWKSNGYGPVPWNWEDNLPTTESCEKKLDPKITRPASRSDCEPTQK